MFMNRIIIQIYFLLTLIFHIHCQPIVPEEIFVVSDVYGILPDGTCNELAGKHFRELKQKNGHWDATTKVIKLYAAKNEEVAVQIIIPQKGKNFSGIMSELVGPKKIDSSRASFSAMGWVNHVSLGSCPDLVIPLDGSINGISGFDIPISFNGIPNPDNNIGIMLFEIWIPKDITAGEYKGTVIIFMGETTIETLNVVLTVFDFVLPDMPTFAFELLSYGMPSENFPAKFYVNAGDGLGAGARTIPEKTKQIDYQVYKMAMDNRCFVNSLPYSSQRGYPRYAYPIEGKGENARVMSYAEWDDFYSPILDGKVNKFGEPPAHFLLPFNSNYPYLCESDPQNQFNFIPLSETVPEGPGQNSDLREFEQTYKKIANQFVDHFAEKGWTKTQFEVFNNQKSRKDRNRLPWKLDEPTDLSDYMGLQYLLNVQRLAFDSAELKGIQIKNRLDIGHFNCDRFLTPDGQPTRCYKSKDYNKYNADKYLKGVVDHWVIGSTHLEAAQQTLQEYNASGVKLMEYSTSGSRYAIGLHYGEFAGEGFRSARMGISGRIIYKLGLDSANPLKVDESDDNTFYSSISMGFEGALSSHRLKLWRNAVNDFDYITAAKKINETATMDIINKVTKVGSTASPKYRERSNARAFWFTNNVEDILRTKIKLAEIITGKKYSAMEIEGFSDKYTPCGSADQIVGYD
jgi:hypothetical protein